MEKLLEYSTRFEQAITLATHGYGLVAVCPGTKRPAFRGWQTVRYTADDLACVFARGDHDVGIRTGEGLVVLDIDSADRAKLKWVIDNCGDTPMRVRTPHGGLHLYFAAPADVFYGNSVRIGGEPYDLRWEGCFVVCPWSCSSNGVAYEWAGPILRPQELPPLNVEPLRKRQLYAHRRVATAVELPMRAAASDKIRDLRAYIRQVPSVQGQNGSAGLMRVCLLLVEDGRGFEAAGAELRSWNKACAVPPWSERELDHALINALKKKRASAVGDGRRSRPLL